MATPLQVVTLFLAAPLVLAQTCGTPQLQLTPDYGLAIGSSDVGSAYTFTLGGKMLAQGPMNQLALFHFDGSLTSTSGIVPVQSAGTSFVPGQFGSAVATTPNGTLAYPQAGDLSFTDGTVEMWVSPQFDGNNAIYSGNTGTLQAQVLFHAQWSDGELILALATHGGGPYVYVGAAGHYAGFPDVSGIAAWKAGQWHHLAFTYSASLGRLRLYVDGTLAQEVTGSIAFPAVAPSRFTIGGDSSRRSSAFAIDEVRITRDEMPAAAIAYDAARQVPLSNNEVFLPLAGLAAGQLTYSVAGCGSATYNFTGIPIGKFSPPDGLLPPGSSVALTFDTLQPTTCRYSIGTVRDYATMQPLDTGPATSAHKVIAAGLSTDPRVLNRLYVRCASSTDYLHSSTYRVVAVPTTFFPRIGNIWNGDYVNKNQPDLAKKIQLFLGPNGMSPADAIALRTLNPNVLILPVTQVDDAFDLTLPERFYLHDTKGNRISDWPQSFVYNMTLPEVATYVGQQAYQFLAQSKWAFDGIFFDSFGTNKPVNLIDVNGKTVQVDADGDGQPDDQARLNAAWAAGQYLAVSTFHGMAPGAYVSGHVLESPAETSSLVAFNGTSIEFFQQYVREGQASFDNLLSLYQSWQTRALPPTMTLMQSAPPNQIAYGYGYTPFKGMPPALADFARTFYPNMRFGLALALMSDGYFSHDIGDMAPLALSAWWYDEYDFNLGFPLGPATRVAAAPAANLLANPGFENGLAGWRLIVNNTGGAQAAATADSTIAAEGTASAHIAIASPGTSRFHVDLEQGPLTIAAGVTYRVQFWARSDSPRTITIFMQGGGPTFPGYAPSVDIAIGTSWSLYSASFPANASATDCRLEFWAGDLAGNVWLDDVQFAPATAEVYRRDFTNGVVLINGSSTAQTISSLTGLQRFKGTQAPLYQYILDDGDPAFSTSGTWNTVTYNTGSMSGAGASSHLPAMPQNANGPYYHAWLGACHQLDGSSGSAQWDLSIPADGTYAIQVWLPAAPNASTWTRSAVYEVVSGGSVIFTATLDQTTATAGDGWHTIASGLNLTAAGAPVVRVRNGGSGSLIADAVYVTSSALHNDGSPAQSVALAPFDGILLQRQSSLPLPTVRINSAVNAAGFQPAIASGGFLSITGAGFASSSRSWTSSDFHGASLPISLDGVSVTINGKPAYVEFTSPAQINAIAPDDDALGQVEVQVKTPQGEVTSANVLKQKLSPAFFTYQAGATTYAAAIHLDGTLVGPDGPSSRPAAPGEVIEIYGTGFGPTVPASPTSQLVSQPAPTAVPATVSIGGVDAPVQFAGLVSSGLYQLNVQIPTVASGDQSIRVNAGGFQGAAGVFVAIR